MVLLTSGEKTTAYEIDDDQYEHISKYQWGLMITETGHKYIRRTTKTKTLVELLLHRYILNPPNGFYVDHIDGNGLNNKISNLRICSNSQNQMNAKLRKDNTSGYKGVHWDAWSQKWRAEILADGIHYRLGRFKTKEDAIDARLKAMVEHHGDFARLE
jgi:hypothetical protein